jgi:hypothetical protein
MDQEHPSSPKQLPTGVPDQKTDFLNSINQLVGRVPTRLQHSRLSVFRALPDQPFLNRFARLATGFISKNYYWIRIFLIIGSIALLILILAPVVAL